MRKKLIVTTLALLLVGLSATPVLACPPPPGVATPGFYKNNLDKWPYECACFQWVDKSCVRWFCQDEAVAYMRMPVRKDKSYTMFAAVMAARLNRLAGNDVSCVVETPSGSLTTVQNVIDNASYWVIQLPPGTMVRASSEDWQRAEWKYWVLDAYNNGDLCAPSRDALE